MNSGQMTLGICAEAPNSLGHAKKEKNLGALQRNCA